MLGPPDPERPLRGGATSTRARTSSAAAGMERLACGSHDRAQDGEPTSAKTGGAA
ncbi:hypothetical protein SLI_1623 [Streptomyces lividans 1326]|uniref:Uncharacterized protein n=1 Tax=Streptomyces lividans 1326 TaxID=1200984 RepID=A0A7U9DPZ6_STRLI|nr:hypothetical protein SLI_1623 [Streptomyces lividans 1326]